jgi:hypothetical protein
MDGEFFILLQNMSIFKKKGLSLGQFQGSIALSRPSSRNRFEPVPGSVLTPVEISEVKY